MTGSDRREDIVRRIQESGRPVPAKELAALYHVSRQVIVQDIALIRAAGYEIISTNRGYILGTSPFVSRVMKVQHTDSQLEEELCAVVDLGGQWRTSWSITGCTGILRRICTLPPGGE